MSKLICKKRLFIGVLFLVGVSVIASSPVYGATMPNHYNDNFARIKVIKKSKQKCNTRIIYAGNKLKISQSGLNKLKICLDKKVMPVYKPKMKKG